MDGANEASLRAELDRQVRLLDEAQAVGRTGAWELDTTTGMLRWSLGLRRLMEMPDSTETITIEESYRFYSKSSEAIVREAFEAAVTRGMPYDLEVEVVTAKGKHLWVREVCRALFRNCRLVSVIGVLQDITERRKLSEFLADAVDQERLRLGTELHDGVGQELTGIALLSRALAEKSREDAPALASDLATLAELASKSVALVRGLAHGMLPFALRQGDFVKALEDFAHATERAFQVRMPVTLRGKPGCMPTSVKAEHLYGIAKEAVANAIHHGHAAQIKLLLGCDLDKTTLTVTDDGGGFDVATRSEGMGMQIMKHRARVLGGFLEVRSAPRRGTVIKAVVPHYRGPGAGTTG